MKTNLTLITCLILICVSLTKTDSRFNPLIDSPEAIVEYSYKRDLIRLFGMSFYFVVDIDTVDAVYEIEKDKVLDTFYKSNETADNFNTGKILSQISNEAQLLIDRACERYNRAVANKSRGGLMEHFVDVISKNFCKFRIRRVRNFLGKNEFISECMNDLLYLYRTNKEEFFILTLS